MNISANGKSLATVTKTLSVQWRQARESWQDAKSGEFDRKYVSELMAGVDRAMPVFDDLDKLIEKIRSDCE